MISNKDDLLKISLYTVLVIVSLLVLEWESTKKAAQDAWDGIYCPPVEVDN